MDWQTLRNQFMRDIGGDPPGAQLEDWLIQQYAEHPDPVQRSFEKIALGYKAGKIRSPWGALKAEVGKAVDAARNPTHASAKTREADLQRAMQNVRNALLHFDRETEVLDELFGDRGSLEDTPANREKVIETWRKLRPLGEQTEREHEAFLERYREHREAMSGQPSTPVLESNIREEMEARLASGGRAPERTDDEKRRLAGERRARLA